MRFGLTAQLTGGPLDVGVETVSQGAGPPMHIHHHMDEYLVIRSGALRCRLGDRDVDLQAGGRRLHASRSRAHVHQPARGAVRRVSGCSIPAAFTRSSPRSTTRARSIQRSWARSPRGTDTRSRVRRSRCCSGSERAQRRRHHIPLVGRRVSPARVDTRIGATQRRKPIATGRLEGGTNGRPAQAARDHASQVHPGDRCDDRSCRLWGIRRWRRTGRRRCRRARGVVHRTVLEALRRAEDPAVEPLRAAPRQVVRSLRGGLGTQGRGEGHRRSHRGHDDPGTVQLRDRRQVRARRRPVHRPAAAARAERDRPGRRDQGGRQALRQADRALRAQQPEPDDEEVLRLRPRLGARSGQLPQEHVDRGRAAERAVDVGRAARGRRRDQVQAQGPGRYRDVAGDRLEHGRPLAAVVLRRRHPGRARSR